MKELLEVFDRNPPEKLLRLLSITKKSDVEKYAAELVVTGDELFSLIVGASRAGYIHAPKFGEFQPKQLQPSRDEIGSLSDPNPSDEREKRRRKLLSKIGQMFVDRKLVAFHFFLAPPRWHLISFNQRDTAETDRNHWVHGSHIHFVNDLWHGLTPDGIVAAFPERPAGVHIRFNRD